MTRFPKFLKTAPEVYGLSTYEIGALIFALYFAMIFNFSSVKSLCICVAFIGFVKLVKKYIDIKGFLAPRIKKIDLSKFKGMKS